MTNSFADQAREKEALKNAPAQVEEAVESPLEIQEEAFEDYSEPEQMEFSKEVQDHLMGNQSFLDKINEANAQKEAEEQEEEERLAEEEEQEQQEAEAEKEAAPKELEINGQKFESIEEVSTHVQTLEEQIRTFQDNEEKIVKILDEVPEFSYLLKNLAKGDSLRVALVKAGFGPEDFNIEDETEADAESLVQAKIERKQAIQAQKKQQKAFEDNMASSEKVLKEFQEKNGMDDATRDKMIAKISQFSQDLTEGKISEEALSHWAKAINYESAVQKAAQSGEVKGRNEKIFIERRKEKGDRIPALGRGTSLDAVPEPRNRFNDIVTMPSGSFMDKLKRNQ